MKWKLGWKNLLALLNPIPVCKTSYFSDPKSITCSFLKIEKNRNTPMPVTKWNYLFSHLPI